MKNRVVIGLIVFLLLITGAGGYWSYALNKQLSGLDSEMRAFKTETAAKFASTQGDITSLDAELVTLDTELGTLDTELAAFKSDTAAKFASTQSSISSISSELSTFKTETAAKFSSTQSDITSLDTELANFKAETASQFSELTMNVRQIYKDAVKGVCQITDGENRIGSGFVFSAEGYIVTPWHVIYGVNSIDVILHDGRIAKASLIGSDRYSDIAVLKLEKGLNLVPLTLADSNTVVNGEPVIVIGAPFELSDTVNYGIVSRKKGMIRYPDGNWVVCNLVQYDAPTNPGNSGSPVINSKGQVIGMAAYGITPESGNGISWAISSNKVNRVARAIIDTGSFKNATLPGSWWMSDLTPGAARNRGLESSFGALFLYAKGVGQVETGDIVVAVDGIPVNEAADLFGYIGEFKSPGDTITLTLVIRGGIKIEVPLVLVEGWVFTG